MCASQRKVNMNTHARLKTSDAAEYIGVTSRTLVRWVNAGRVRAYKFSPRRLAFDKEDLDAFLEAHASISADEVGK